MDRGGGERGGRIDAHRFAGLQKGYQGGTEKTNVAANRRFRFFFSKSCQNGFIFVVTLGLVLT